MRHVSYEYMSCLIEMSHVSYEYVSGLIEMSHVSYEYVSCLIEMSHVSYEYVSCLIEMSHVSYLTRYEGINKCIYRLWSWIWLLECLVTGRALPKSLCLNK